jgi:hypothetical protein
VAGQPPLAPELLPGPAPPAQAPPPSPAPGSSIPRRQYSGYAGILQGRLERHKAERPGLQLSEEEVEETVEEVKKSTSLGERSTRFRQTGQTSSEQVRRDLITLFKAEHNRQATEKQAMAQALASIDQARLKEGLPPLGPGFSSPEAQAALAPIQQIQMQRKAEAKSAAEREARIKSRKDIGKNDPTKWNVEDMIAYDEGRLKDRTQIRAIPTQQQFEQVEFGGDKYVKPPEGFKRVEPGKPPGPTPEEKDMAAATKSELSSVRRTRQDIGNDLAKLQGEVAAFEEEVTSMEALDEIDSDDEELAKARSGLRRAKAQIKSLGTRDTELSGREDSLRTQMSGVAKPPAGPLPKELAQFAIKDDLSEPAMALSYIAQLARSGLSRQQIISLLYQHTELDREDIAALYNRMPEMGIR